MLAEDIHKSVEDFMEKNASEGGDFLAGCGRPWIYQQNVNLSTYMRNCSNTLMFPQFLNDLYSVVISRDSVLIQRLWIKTRIVD